ncbi:decaprenyl-phosphate phosphoribosyltransferase [Streptacidiphilus sp. P02-A3a]|uniref:decaprenyl-phosphate phosphoribosyltransferase n=1 Tax=Streptacidiphilus sp. P02-A3a TaxID=2704468 RepID=UPI0015FD6B6F|nr:decaprenyl-phosphate phosphoribosyltransferase [Streptacidiphilus sp. P02-A3a]QMU71031.1 decaprenyl-phosphate phosphoribosyltransferase [Streptacidiphilus sp. P02-A3a]
MSAPQPTRQPAPAAAAANAAAAAAAAVAAVRPVWVRWPVAAVRTARPRQWPKNFLVFAAPLTGSALARGSVALRGATLALLVFTLASCAVYFVNDAVDAERDRQHPRKCLRPVACGDLSENHALALAGGCVLAAAALVAAGGAFGFGYGLALAVTAYLATSFLYSFGLKHLPVVELALVASGFVLRALGGAASSQVPPSGWFVLVCSLGALLVVIAKRYTEITSLGAPAARHRPSLRRYTPRGLRATQRVTALLMVAAYLAWAATEPDRWAGNWHLATAVPLACALARFDRLTATATTGHIEDLIIRDLPMVCLEAVWLLVFVVGLATHP